SIDAPKKDVRFEAGVYRNGGRLIAVNRPPSESDLETLDKSSVKHLFSPVPVQFFEERGGEAGALQGEIWRTLLIAMLVALRSEALLSLPARFTRPQQKPPAPARAAFAQTVSS